VFHRFRPAKFAYGGSILSSSQFFILPQWPLKMTLAIKVVKIHPKIIILLPKYKSVKKTVINQLPVVQLNGAAVEEQAVQPYHRPCKSG
jgi:hypothetical protein